MTAKEFKTWASERKISLVPSLGALKLGQIVTFTNEYGVSFPGLEIIGIADDSYDFYGRRIFLDCDCWWFPKEPKALK